MPESSSKETSNSISHLISVRDGPFKEYAKANVIIVGCEFPKQASAFFVCRNADLEKTW